MADVMNTARKEFRSFFASPAALLFLGAFLAATLFIVFWLEAFFARNIADVRPLFQWMPVLMIFLVAALTMRAWSEERRAGTLEVLLTAPVRPLSLILGKFVAALALVAVALVLTLPLPITVALLGPLDWGPVVGGYIATLFLAAAYVAIGLYMSGRTDNPIVALILTAVTCGLIYLIGSPTLTNLFGHQVGGVLGQLGTGSRFESITRGVLDLRDLYYYLSIVGVFLTLNLFSLERLRWAANPGGSRHRQWGLVAVLAIANFAAANVWLSPVGWARADITEGKSYSLSEATDQYLDQLQEPLLIRGYFSSKTHPLLAPLVPRVKDLLEEYAVAAGGRARVEFIDPHENREAEEEAAQKYGVRPVPFQVASKYQAGVVSSYFDIVVAYGDQHEALGFRDLIEVKAGGEGELSVALKNPEYAVTGAIRKVINSYQASGNPFETLTSPVTFHGYVSADERLPAQLKTLRTDLQSVLDELKQQAGDKLTVSFADPDADGGKLANTLQEQYGFSPQIASLVDPKPFWFYMLLESSGQTVQIPLPQPLQKEPLEQAIEAGIQRLAPGFLKTVAVVKPQSFGPHGTQYQRLTDVLRENVRLKDTDLSDGRVPADADLLLVLAPKDLDDKQRFAIDQFLMQGGSVVLATSPFTVDTNNGTLNAARHTSGLEDWLRHYGVTLDQKMVLDPQNAALPVPVQRFIGSLPVREIRMVSYPHFPDLRADGLNADNPITASLQQLTLNWASPLQIDPDKNNDRQVIELLKSSPQSWASDSLDVIPDYRAHPANGFAQSGETGSRTLAVALEGRFESFYKGKQSPLAAAGEDDKKDTEQAAPIASVIDRSPDSARLIVIASNAFANDMSIQLASEGLRTFYSKPMEFLQNAIDYSLEDRGLLALRGRTQFARTLLPLTERDQMLWEYLNYGLALAGLIVVWGWRRLVRRADRVRYQQILAEV